MTVESNVISVTATDTVTGDSSTEEIDDSYMIVTAGTAIISNVQVHWKKDGTCTHVITVRGIRAR